MGRIAFAIGGLTVLASLPAASTSDAVDPALDPPRVTSATASAGLIQISQMGVVAGNPQIVYNPDANEFLVAWIANGSLYGQRIDAVTGGEVGENDFRISESGSPVGTPSVVYDALSKEYVVIWEGPVSYRSDPAVWRQSLSAEGADVGSDAIVHKPPMFFGFCDGQRRFPVWCSGGSFGLPGVGYNSTTGQILIVGHEVVKITDPPDLQKPTAIQSTGTVGVLRPTGGLRWYPISLGGQPPAVAHNPISNEYLIAAASNQSLRVDANGMQIGSAGNAGGGGKLVHNAIVNEYFIAHGSNAVVARRISPDGVSLGEQILIQPAAENGSSTYVGVAFAPPENEYLITWKRWVYGTSPTVRGRRVSASGIPIGTDALFLVLAPVLVGDGVAAAYDVARRRYLVVAAGAVSEDRYEIFAQMYSPPSPFVVGAGADGAGQWQSWKEAPGYAPRHAAQLPWPAYNALNGELHPAVGDVDGDGLDETIVGLGRGGDGWIAIFDDTQHGGALLTWIRLPWPSYNASNGTIWPAVGDIDGDGTAEIVAGVGAGGGGWYAIFDDASQNYAFLTWRRVNWPWYNDTQSGETRPAVANIDGGSFSEIVIGLGAGGGGWMELVDDAAAGYAHLRWLRVGWSDYSNGPGETFPAAGDTDGDGYDEIVVGLGATSQGWVEVFDDAFAGLVHTAWLQVSWPDYATASGETHPAVGDVDGDADAEIILGLGTYTGQGGWFEIRDGSTTAYAPLGWFNMRDTQIYQRGAATFPAASRRRP